MHCEEFIELLDRYESIDDLDRECMDAHCELCDECRKEMDFYKAINNISAFIPCPAPPKTLIAEVNAKLDAMEVAPVVHRTKSWSIKRYATLAACLAVGVAVGINGGYIKDRLSDNNKDGVINENVVVTEPDNGVQKKATEETANVSVNDEKPASSEGKKTAANTENTEKAESSATEINKGADKPAKVPQVPQTPDKSEDVEKAPSKTEEATQAPAKTEAPEKIDDVAKAEPETTPSVNDYTVVGEGTTVAYYNVGTRNSMSKGVFADYILVSDADMGAVFSIMSEMGVSSLDGFYMTTRTNFYQMLERFDIEGIKYDYELIYNTGDNIAFKLRYSVAR